MSIALIINNSRFLPRDNNMRNINHQEHFKAQMLQMDQIVDSLEMVHVATQRVVVALFRQEILFQMSVARSSRINYSQIAPRVT